MATNLGMNFSASQKQNAGDSFTAHLAGMSKNQLFDVMSQMKSLIEQNPSQARQILVANPSLTKALFQAQIMLGMVQPPQVMPNIQQAASQQPQQSLPLGLQTSAQVRPSVSVTAAAQGQSVSSQPLVQNRQPSLQSSVPVSSSLLNPPIQPVQAAQHAQTNINIQTSSMSLPQPSQTSNVPILSHHAALQSTVLQSQVLSSQLQPPMLNPGTLQQPPLPQQPRPSMQQFPHQLQPPMPPSYGFQSSTMAQQLSQPLYQAGISAPSSLGNFAQGPPTLPGQPPLMKSHQAGSHLGGDLGSQNTSSMQMERGSAAPWMSASPDIPVSGVQLPGPTATVTGQIGAIGQAARPSQLSPDIEKALLQQVMSLTPEQINLLPPEQRQQVLQLQQMLRSQDIGTASV
ncbi:unnamed protein product [Victoria cruziana]